MHLSEFEPQWGQDLQFVYLCVCVHATLETQCQRSAVRAAALIFISVFWARWIRRKAEGCFYQHALFLALYAHAHWRFRPCHQAHRGESLLWFEPEGLWALALYQAHCVAISLPLLLAPVSLPQGLCPSNTWLCNNGLLCTTPPVLPRRRRESRSR